MLKRICTEINGIFYKSLCQAGKELGIDKDTVKNRALSKKHPNYNIVPFRVTYSEKQCSKCKEIKSLELFPDVKSKKLDGKSSWCKKCCSNDTMERDKRDPSKSRERIKRFNKTLKGKISRRYHKANRRAREKNANVVLSIEEQKTIKQIYKSMIQLRKKGIKVVVDHIIPISRGGKHRPENLRIVTEKFNSKKHNKLDCELIT